MFDIVFTPEAVDDLRSLRKFDQERVISAVETQLAHQPDQPTRNRKRVRPNALAEWELRVDQFRIFYNVDASNQTLKIEAVGFKRGNTLFIHGEEFEL